MLMQGQDPCSGQGGTCSLAVWAFRKREIRIVGGDWLLEWPKERVELTEPSSYRGMARLPARQAAPRGVKGG